MDGEVKQIAKNTAADDPSQSVFNRADGPSEPGPELPRGSVYTGVSVVIDENGTWWRVDANEGSVRRCFRRYRSKEYGTDEIHIGSTVFREVK